MGRYERDANTGPLAPAVGFVVLVGLTGASYLLSPAVIRWLVTTRFSLGFLGPILPVQFPANWSFLVQRMVVTSGFFLVLFVLFMGVIFFLIPRETDPTGIDIHEIRKEHDKRFKNKRRR